MTDSHGLPHPKYDCFSALFSLLQCGHGRMPTGFNIDERRRLTSVDKPKLFNLSACINSTIRIVKHDDSPRIDT